MDDSASKEGRYRAAWAAKKKTYQLDKNIEKHFASIMRIMFYGTLSLHIQQLDLLFKNVVCTVCSYEYVFVGILTLKFEIRVNVRCFFPCYLHRI